MYKNTNIVDIHHEDFKWPQHSKESSYDSEEFYLSENKIKKPRISPNKTKLNNEIITFDNNSDEQCGSYENEGSSGAETNCPFVETNLKESSILLRETTSLITEGIAEAFDTNEFFMYNKRDGSYNANYEHCEYFKENINPEKNECSESSLNVFKPVAEDNIIGTGVNTWSETLPLNGIQTENHFYNTLLSPPESHTPTEQIIDSPPLTNKVLLAFTPAGQLYECLTENPSHTKPKGSRKSGIYGPAAIFNTLKKIPQIESGMFIPPELDVHLEERFQCLLAEKKAQMGSLLKSARIKINPSSLSGERILIKLDRYVKQYMQNYPQCVIEMLEVVKRTELYLINLISVPQVYKTIMKVAKNYQEGTIRDEANLLLQRFKILISPPDGKENEEHYIQFFESESIKSLKLTIPRDWIIH